MGLRKLSSQQQKSQPQKVTLVFSDWDIIRGAILFWIGTLLAFTVVIPILICLLWIILAIVGGSLMDIISR